MTRAPFVRIPLDGQFHFSVSDLVQSILPARFVARDPWTSDARLHTFSFDPPSTNTETVATSVSSVGGGGWSVRSFSSGDAGDTSGNWTVIGGRPGQDSRTDPGAVTHPGTPGNDVVLGGPGEDTVSGGLGDDTLSGGAGADTFLYAAGDGNDTITDFERGVDRLVILGVSGINLVSNGGVATVTLADGSQITLHSAAPTPSADGSPLG